MKLETRNPTILYIQPTHIAPRRRVGPLGTLRSDDGDGGDGGEELQKSNRFSNQNNTFARASRFFVHFFAVTARLRRENAQFHVVQRRYTSDDEISSLYLNLDMVLRNSTLEGSTCI